MSRQLKRKEFKEILALPGIKLIPLQFIFTQYLRPMDLFVLDPGDVEKPQPIRLADIYQCQSALYAREAFTDLHAARRFEPDVAVITLRVGHLRWCSIKLWKAIAYKGDDFACEKSV